LRLGGNSIGRSGCVALGNLIENPTSRLEDLRIDGNGIDDGCVDILTNALSRDNKLKKLALSQNEDITDVGWRSLSAVLRPPGCMALVEIDLSESGLDDEGAEAIANALAINKTLKILHLCYNEGIGPDGWLAFFDMMQNSESALEEINLSENVGIDDEAAVAMTYSFASLQHLKILRLDENRNIQVRGWQAIAYLVNRCQSTLVELDLSSNEIEDAAAAALSYALTNSPSLKVLNLQSNISIGTVGWRAFALFLQSSVVEDLKLSMNDEALVALADAFATMRSLKYLSLAGLSPILSMNGCRALSAVLGEPNSALKAVKLYTNKIGDEGAVAFASVLEVSGNSTLEILDIQSNRIGAVGWQAFSQLICNETSIMDTYSSNHCLHHICQEHISNAPCELLSLLKLNRQGNKNEVARQKILRAHFYQKDINAQAFILMDLKVLPLAMAWMGKDYMGHSLLLQVVKSVPSLFEANCNSHTLGAKRKWSD